MNKFLFLFFSLLLLISTYSLTQYTDLIISNPELKNKLKPYKINTHHLHQLARFISKKTQHLQHIEVIKYSIKTRRENAKPIKIAQFTDLHYDAFEDPPTLPQHLENEMIQKILEEKPDYVLITGDFVHGEVIHSSRGIVNDILKPMKIALQQIHNDTKQRIYSVFGNHDLHTGQRHFLKQVLEYGNMTVVLDNEYYYDEDNDIVIIGLPDYHKDDFNPVRLANLISKNPKITNNSTHIVMSHVPDSASCLIEKQGKIPKYENCKGVQTDVLLTGHTHAGQFKIFGWSIVQFIFQKLPESVIQFLLKSMKFKNPIDNWDWNEGMFETNENNHLVPLLESHRQTMSLREGKSFFNINRGVGGHFGIRLACQPEMTLLEFD
ncbi:predicted protein [Naegleria gruberi]|uniref:Predicted protein n=1 Tax=Naegleria gruberi TaxID=5762 RepID=D2VZA2_NAEGR|nr:uncharacterized protein NAEGRDRAFT_74419 [Naegleria gruberi]EFC37811.1 predicted protein [Naegleria gruberi]|eukprot:XP_002670555.1 predicted protein [Naegleria gruberi strain NEG-M]